MTADNKLRGRYYTPADIASYLVRWATQNNPKTILEPSCGDGVFVREIASIENCKQSKITAIELNEEEISKANKSVCGQVSDANFINADFLDYVITNNLHEAYDAVVGNPPYIRYHFMSDEMKSKSATIMLKSGLKPSKLLNIWIPFIVSSIEALKPGGRLAMVIPSEILSTNTPEVLRDFIVRMGRRTYIIAPEKLWFGDALQGTVAMFFEKIANGEKNEGVFIKPVMDKEFLSESFHNVFSDATHLDVRQAKGKWVKAFIGKRAFNITSNAETINNIHRLGDIATTHVGPATGANEFFIVGSKVLEKYSLHQWAKPTLTRHCHDSMVIYDSNAQKIADNRGIEIFILDFNSVNPDAHKGLKNYLEFGIAAGFNKPYKCKIRKNWYAIPKSLETDLSLPIFIGDFPKIIFSEMKVTTDCSMIRITPKQYNPKEIAYNFFNSLTALSTELESKVFGGGLIQCYPSDARRLLIPMPDYKAGDLERLNTLMKTIPMKDLFIEQSELILGNIGLSKNDRVAILEAWLKLKSRRTS